MHKRNGSNVLLVEILIAVLFFMLSATVLAQVFAASKNLTVRSGVETRALAQAQNIADALYAADDPDAALEAMEFVNSHGAWSKDYDSYSLYVTTETEYTDAGEIWLGTVRAFYALRNPDDARQSAEELFQLPVARYREEME
ncbi:MAG: hypothetical protein IJ234_09440 [Clostridia bacterium]|nr:hypothetical protein [Clostridia bacterium]